MTLSNQEEWVTVTPNRDDPERLEAIARHRRVPLHSAAREALMKGMHVHNVDQLKKRLETLIQERSELNEKRGREAPIFGELSGHDSSLRFECHELYSINKSLTMNLSGRGLGQKFPELLDRYLFANNPKSRRNG